MKPATFRELERISQLPESEIRLSVIKREIENDPEIARLYCEAYSGIALIFPEGSKERKECLKILEIAKSGGNR
jgi:hypothetical protein